MIVNEVEGGDQERTFRVALHPCVTVVTGLSAEQRREFGASLSASIHGYQTGLKLNVNIFGQEGRLSPQVIAALGFAGLDIENVLDGADIPGVHYDADLIRPSIHEVLGRLRHGELAQSPATVVSVTSAAKAGSTSNSDHPEGSTEEPPVALEADEPDVDPYQSPEVQEKIRRVDEVRAQLEKAAAQAALAKEAAAAAAKAVEEAKAVAVGSTEAEPEQADPDDGDIRLPPPPEVQPFDAPGFFWDDAFSGLIEEETAALEGGRTELESVSAEIDAQKAGAEEAVARAVFEAEAVVTAAEERVAQAKADFAQAEHESVAAEQELATLEAALDDATNAAISLMGAAQVNIPSSVEVERALGAAIAATSDQEDTGLTLGQRADRWAELQQHLADLRAMPMPPAWMITQVRDEYDEAKARVTALRFQKESGIDVREVLSRAEERFNQATADWEEMKAGPALQYERTDAEATRFYAECVEVLGFQPGRKFLGEALRAEQEKLDQVASPDKRLRDALAAVGVNATAGDAIETAQSWLAQTSEQRRLKEEAVAAHTGAVVAQEAAQAAVDHQRETSSGPGAERLDAVRVELARAEADLEVAKERLNEIRQHPDDFRAQALVRLGELESRAAVLEEAVQTAEANLAELNAERSLDQGRSRRAHEKVVEAARTHHEKVAAQAQQEYERQNAEALTQVEARRRARAVARAERREQMMAEVSAQVAEVEKEAAVAAATAAQVNADHERLLSKVSLAQDAVETAVELERQRLRDEADAARRAEENDRAEAERTQRQAEREAQRSAEAEAARQQGSVGAGLPWWHRAPGVVSDDDELDFTKVKRDEVDFYVLAMGASLRAVGRTESMPLVIDAAFDELPPLVAQAAFDGLAKIYSIVQVVYLASNDKGVRWIERQRDAVGRESQFLFS